MPLHFFNAGELSYQKGFAARRQRFLRPILVLLHSLRISPDHVTLASMAVMLLLPAGIHYGVPWLCVAAYVLHLALDAVDGSLARHLKRNSDAGAYMDAVADHFAVLVTSLTLLWFGIRSPFWLAAYTISYMLVIVHVMVLNAHGTPSSVPVARTRYPFFLLVILYAYGRDVLLIFDVFLMVVTLYYAAMLVLYIFHLRWSLHS
ncbi:MAG: CDP-alcohol phosphatidyltransferase family protein [Candidatus Peribacteraceae bacterium]|nr:CDP-alcohol phosphatidyltransferase family protein [Candidatus Peribacteraceae bacterium]